MPVARQFIQTDISGAGLAVDLSTTDDAYIGVGIEVTNTNAVDQYDVTIQGLGDSHDVDVYGLVTAYGMAINLGASTVANHDNSVHVGETGYVASQSNAGIAMLGYGSVIDNDGSIYGGSNGIAWWSAPAEAASQKSYILNSGHVEGENAGIYMDTSETVVIRNSGVISGGSYSISITGSGPIRVVNHGLLDGLVALGGGNDIYNGSDGEANGNIQGFGGNDRLLGGDSEDILFGNEGKDTLTGGAGNDFLGGGDGIDRLTGGADSDQFLYFTVAESADKANADLITDFSHAAGDIIGLGSIDARAPTNKNDAFKFIGDADFSGKSGELRYEIVGDRTYVEGNTDADTDAEFVIALTGKISLVAGDFSL
jgi:Ca2+-binding RTX toxin-like protein